MQPTSSQKESINLETNLSCDYYSIALVTWYLIKNVPL